MLIYFQPLATAGTPSTGRGCSKPSPTWPWTLPWMAQPQLLWRTSASASHSVCGPGELKPIQEISKAWRSANHQQQWRNHFQKAVAGLVLPSLSFVMLFNLISIFPAFLYNLLLLHFSVLLSWLPKDEHFQNSHSMELLSRYFFSWSMELQSFPLLPYCHKYNCVWSGMSHSSR